MYACNGCARRFKSIRVFDRHQAWDYSKPHGQQLTCEDITTLRDSSGKLRYRVNGKGMIVRVDRGFNWRDNVRRTLPSEYGA